MKKLTRREFGIGVAATLPCLALASGQTDPNKIIDAGIRNRSPFIKIPPGVYDMKGNPLRIVGARVDTKIDIERCVFKFNDRCETMIDFYSAESITVNLTGNALFKAPESPNALLASVTINHRHPW
jgi:hypothetical protein